jgi:hypothetical protein
MLSCFYLRGRGIEAFFFSPVSNAASICCSFARRACFSAPKAANAVCTLAVSIYVLAVSEVAGFAERALAGRFDRALAGASDLAVRDESGSLELV